MTFKFNFEENTKPQMNGKFEVLISQIVEKVAGTGRKYLNISFIVRNDIDQPYKNAYIWDTIYADDKGEYNKNMLNQLGYCANLSQDKVYNSLEEVLDDFRYKPMTVEVKTEISEWQGKKYENVNVKKRFRTEFPLVNHQFKDERGNVKSVPQGLNQFADAVNIVDEDLPF